MTIRHVVSWQLATADPAEKAEQAARIAESLEALVGQVDGLHALTVGTDVVGGGNWDVVLIADFDDVEAIDRYQVHPEHVTAAGYIRSVVAQRSCVDFAL
ncbi:Dabb family protein [Leifsonia kafniensis]|uniref:Dabb family protein n=1 Tax=Leifsonia kafniensis TaxID=475957 RepID=A0ABP7KPP9_9MICO